MYLDHFGLSAKPFTNSPAEGFFSPNPAYDAAVTRMEQVLLSRDAVAIISGGPGVGKTTLVASAAERVGDKAVVAYVDMRLLQPELLFDLLLLKLGGESGNGDEATSLYRLKSAIAQHNEEQGRKVTAVIDVSNLTIERAKRIMQLVHMAGEPDGQMNIVLLGPHGLHKLLDTPGLIHIRQRVTYRLRVRPLAVQETEKYMAAQIENAGGQTAAIFAHGASIMVFKYVGGVPRLINTLLDATLNHAAEQGAESVSPEMVTEVAQLLGWRRLGADQQAAMPSRPKQPAKESAATQKPANQIPSSLDELSLESSEPSPKPKPERVATQDDNPIGEGTAMLLAAALDSSNEPEEQKPESRREAAKAPSLPEMDAEDTSATGMLKLEDLDARFAETIFGDDFKKAAAEAQE